MSGPSALCLLILAHMQQRFGGAGGLMFYKFIKAKVHFKRGRENSHAGRLKKGPNSLCSSLYIPQCYLREAQFDLLIGLGEDTLFAWGQVIWWPGDEWATFLL